MGFALVSTKKVLLIRFPFLEKNFTQFQQQGPFSHLFSDGEYFSGKGVGRVSVSPKPGINIDVFVTHTISEGKYYLRASY